MTLRILHEPKLSIAAAKHCSRLVPVYLLFFFFSPLTALWAGPEILGLQLGMKQSVVRDLFGKGGISLSEIDSQHLSAPSAPTPVQGVREVRLIFEKDALRKITIFFEIPPHEPTADTLISLYQKEKERLKQLFGTPGVDAVDMQVPSPRDRYEWLARGRGYYLSSWVVEHQMKVTLWLYGEDYGIVLMEMYESVEK